MDIRSLFDPESRAKRAVYDLGNRGRQLSFHGEPGPGEIQQAVLKGDAYLGKIEDKGLPADQAVARATRKAAMDPRLSVQSAFRAQQGAFTILSFGSVHGPIGRALARVGFEALHGVKAADDKAAVGETFHRAIVAEGELPQERALSEVALGLELSPDAAAVAAEKSLGLTFNHWTMKETRTERVLADFAQSFAQESHLGTPNYLAVGDAVIRGIANHAENPDVAREASSVLRWCADEESRLDPSWSSPEEWRELENKIGERQTAFLAGIAPAQ